MRNAVTQRKIGNESQLSGQAELSTDKCLHKWERFAKALQLVEDWEFSSFRDYAGLRAGSLCDQARANSLLDLNMDRFYEQSYEVINPEKAKGIF